MAGGSSRFSIEAVISMIDRVSGPMKNASGSVGAFSNKARGHFLGVGNAASSALGFLGVAGGAGLIYMGMKKIVTEAANFENSVASFTTLLGGSSTEAKKLVGALQVLGAETPFEFKDLANATQRLLGFGVVTKDTAVPTLRMLGDLAQGSAEKLQGISLVYGQIMAGGKMMGQDFNQLINQGVPIAQGLAKVWGVDVTEAIKRVKSSGGIASKDVQAAMQQMTGAGGLFEGGMLRSSKTLTGLWSTFQDSISMTAGAIGAELLPTIKEVLISLTKISSEILVWVQNNKDGIAKIIEDIKSALSFLWKMRYVILAIVGAFTLYRIAMVAAAVATKGLVIASAGLKIFQAIKILGFVNGIKYLTLGTKAAAVAQWLFNTALFGCPIVWIIAAIAAFVAITVVLIKNWDTFGAAMTTLMGPIGSIISMFKTMYDRWSDITNAFQTGGILAGFIMIGKVILDSVLYPIQQVLQLLSNIPGLGGIAGGAASKIQGFRENQLGAKPAAAATPQSSYASPQSNQMAFGGSTFASLDINVNTPKGAASIERKGTMPAGARLNVGEQVAK